MVLFPFFRNPFFSPLQSTPSATLSTCNPWFYLYSTALHPDSKGHSHPPASSFQTCHISMDGQQDFTGFWRPSWHGSFRQPGSSPGSQEGSPTAMGSSSLAMPQTPRAMSRSIGMSPGNISPAENFKAAMVHNRNELVRLFSR